MDVLEEQGVVNLVDNHVLSTTTTMKIIGNANIVPKSGRAQADQDGRTL